MKWQRRGATAGMMLILGATLLEAGCSGGVRHVSSDESDAVPIVTGEAELRRVLFDEALIGHYAANPLILAKAGVLAGVVRMEKGDLSDRAEASGIRNAMAVAEQAVAPLGIADRVWRKMYTTIPAVTLNAVYDIAHNPAFKRCADVDIAFLEMVDTDFQGFIEQTIGEDDLSGLTASQQAEIDDYLEKEALFLSRMAGELGYWSALGNAVILKSLSESAVANPRDMGNAAAHLAALLDQLHDEEGLIAEFSAMTNKADLRTETAAVFVKCDPEAAEAYWRFTTDPRFREYHHTTWAVFYSVVTKAMKPLLGL